MIDIISAREAFNESKYRKEADEILKDIVLGIKEACNQGRFEVITSIDSRTEKGTIDLIINDLKKKGYKAVFEKDNDIPACEHYWDHMIINWNLQ